MTCNECRRQWVGAEGEKEAPESVREHLAVCAVCRDFVQENGRLRAQVRKLAETEPIPQNLRVRIQTLVQGKSGIRVRMRRYGLGAAAAFVFVALGGYGLLWYQSARPISSDRLAREFVADHLHYLPGREQIVSESARDVERWFQGRVDFPLRVPAVPAAALEDGRLCIIAGRKAALLHYRHKPDDTLVSLFIAEAPPRIGQPENSAALSASYQGCNTLLWYRRGLVYSLVATLGDDPLKAIAESVRQQQP